MISMGRHAADSDDEAEVDDADRVTVPLGGVTPEAPEATEAAEAARPPGSRPQPGPRGRHAHPDDDDDDDDDEPAATKREGTTAADLRLLRTDPALRSRVAAAVVVPFVVYVVILLGIGRMDAFAVWVWIPLITAGIGGGLLLDAAHSKEKKAAG